MPKIERAPFTVVKTVVHKGTIHESKKWKLEGRKEVFGKRIRQFFETEKAAREAGNRRLAELRSHGLRATELTDFQRADAAQAIQLLNSEVPLQEVVSFYLENRRKPSDITVWEGGIRFLESRGIPESELKRKAFERRPAELRLNDFGGYRKSHRYTLFCRLKPFLKDYAKFTMREASHKAPTIKKWLEKKNSNNITRDNRRRSISSFFLWGIAEEYCAKNPAETWTELKKQVNKLGKRKPPILTPEQLQLLLHSAQKHSPNICAALAISVFSGARVSEIEKMSWSDIKLDDLFMHVPLEHSKSETREVKILDALLPWLQIYKGSGSVVTNFAKKRRKLCKLIHLQWKHNFARHSYGSYRYTHTENLETTAFSMGHEDINTFRKWYLNRGITRKEADAYWAIRPDPKYAGFGTQGTQ